MKNKIILFAVLTLASIVVGFLLVPFPLEKRIDGKPVPVVKAEIRNLLTAVHSYQSQYGRLPVVNQEVELQNNEVITALLTATGDEALIETHNPRKIQFFSAPTNRMAEGQLLDPWGSPYNFAFRVHGRSELRIGTNTIADDLAIWSNGPNKRDESGEGDDVASWKLKRR